MTWAFALDHGDTHSELFNFSLFRVSRTHDVSVKWLSQAFREEPQIELNYICSKEQCADIFTKAFDDASKWEHAVSLIGLRGPREGPSPRALDFNVEAALRDSAVQEKVTAAAATWKQAPCNALHFVATVLGSPKGWPSWTVIPLCALRSNRYA